MPPSVRTARKSYLPPPIGAASSVGEFHIGWLNCFRQPPTFTHLTVEESATGLTAGPASSPSGTSVSSHTATAFLSATDAAAPADAGTITIETLTVSDCSLRRRDTPFAFEHLHTTGPVRGRDAALAARQRIGNVCAFE
ncbi:MAG: hypothetical protein SNJ67_10085 [Chloracidobacterium sp.]|uniref:Uncharacterized protein n=1 Tax=Chloracidobacterium validum TaxID=2821543 RepID=A0ABX8BCK1_9BACT|nr:hypothetical protein [Chloracidobacterium validum]QUW04411.1 hypothetical protein J8C06_11475 [Chloracidobacterium validum]